MSGGWGNFSHGLSITTLPSIIKIEPKPHFHALLNTINGLWGSSKAKKVAKVNLLFNSSKQCSHLLSRRSGEFNILVVNVARGLDNQKKSFNKPLIVTAQAQETHYFFHKGRLLSFYHCLNLT